MTVLIAFIWFIIGLGFGVVLGRCDEGRQLKQANRSLRAEIKLLEAQAEQRAKFNEESA